MEEDTLEIKVRRHPLFAVLFGALAIAGGIVGWQIDQYGILFVGLLCLVLAASLYIFPALVLTPNSVELRNLFGFTGRVIPHDGLGRLSVREGKLHIVYAGRQATLPRPNKTGLHRGDWNFMEDALKKAAELERNSRR